MSVICELGLQSRFRNVPLRSRLNRCRKRAACTSIVVIFELRAMFKANSSLGRAFADVGGGQRASEGLRRLSAFCIVCWQSCQSSGRGSIDRGCVSVADTDQSFLGVAVAPSSPNVSLITRSLRRLKLAATGHELAALTSFAGALVLAEPWSTRKSSSVSCVLARSENEQ